MLLKGQRLTSPTDDAFYGLWRFLPIARLLIPFPYAAATNPKISNSISTSPTELHHSKTGDALLLSLCLFVPSVSMTYRCLDYISASLSSENSASKVFYPKCLIVGEIKSYVT